MHSLDGVFASVILDVRDASQPKLYAARDPIGVRPLFFATDEEGRIQGFASELKSLHSISHRVMPFPPGHYFTVDLNTLEYTSQ